MTLHAGDKFEFCTKTFRRGVAKVLAVTQDAWRDRPLYCEWHDQNGKHYEYFKESDFATIKMKESKHAQA